MNEVVFTIGGEAGQGVESSGAGFARALSREYHIFGVADYESRIRGGHNSYHIRASDQVVRTHAHQTHVLIGLDKPSYRHHKHQMASGAAFVYDASRTDVDENEVIANGHLPLAAPLEKLAVDVGGNKIMANTAALGVAAGLSSMDFTPMAEIMRRNFGKKSADLAEKNIEVGLAALEWAKSAAPAFPYKLPKPLTLPPRMLVHGNQAFALGALAAGCKFISGYPMTPWSSAFEYLINASKEGLGIVAHQVEDEIAAISAALGASWSGLRAMTGSSGGGFDLMVEHLSLAGINEVPIVVLVVQRGGPGTGMPTRDEQSDLITMLGAGHGEFPRIILAVKDLEDTFSTAARAFNLAEKYQTPVIVLSSLHLSHLVYDVEPGAFSLEKVQSEIDRAKTLDYAALDKLPDDSYGRYQLTEDGISPRAIVGHPKAFVHGMSDEHTEHGGITEDPENRNRMMKKRMKKLENARLEMHAPELYGAADAEVTLVGWGSTYQTLREAVDRLGGRANLLQFGDLQPFPASAQAMLEKAKKLVTVEQNYTSQLALMIRMETGMAMHHHITKYDGRPFTPQWIVDQVLEQVFGESKPTSSRLETAAHGEVRS